MDDHTINALQSKNSELYRRLRLLLNETSDGDPDIDIVKQTLNDADPHIRRKQAELTIKPGGNSTIPSKGSREENKENWRLKHFSQLKETVEEIKKAEYDLPKRERIVNMKSKPLNGNPEHKRNEELYQRDVKDPLEPSRISNDSGSAYREKSLYAKIDQQNKLLASLRQQVQTKDIERQELVEEFQIQQANIMKEYKVNEANIRRDHEAQLQRQVQQSNSTLNSRIALLESKLDTLTKNEEQLQKAINKMSAKLVSYRRDIHDLHEKNDSLVSINLFLTNQVRQLENNEQRRKEEGKRLVDQKRLEQQMGNGEDTKKEVHIQLEPTFTDPLDDDTNQLVSGYAVDTTTDYLIHGGCFQEPNHYKRSPKSLRSYLLAVLFISRLQRQVKHRQSITKNINDLCHDDKIDLKLYT